MRKSQLVILPFIFSLCLHFTACDRKGGSSSSAKQHEGPKLGLVFDRGGKDDRSFNESAYRGARQAEKELGFQVKVVETADDNAFESLLRGFARKEFDLIVGIGFSQADPLKKVATEFPQQKFLLIDAVVDLPNVASAMFREHEGSYVVGALAALSSKTGKIGLVGGMDIPLVRRFGMGYEAGAKSVRPEIQVLQNYIGVTSEAWNNPPKAKELSLAQIGRGVDVIYSVSGASGSGIFDAVEEKKVLAIGVDSNQNYLKPGRILTSMLKRVDVAVFQVAKSLKDGKFTSGKLDFGFHNQGVDYVIDEHNRALITPELEARMETLKREIQSGKIQVPDFYEKRTP
jgi:basic membrane protein A